ncbi:hypothetical protein NFJ02_14g16920 [Pycnococcus provasolii]
MPTQLKDALVDDRFRNALTARALTAAMKRATGIAASRLFIVPEKLDSGMRELVRGKNARHLRKHALVLQWRLRNASLRHAPEDLRRDRRTRVKGVDSALEKAKGAAPLGPSAGRRGGSKVSAMDVARYVGDPDGPVAEALREYAIKPRARNVSSMDVRRAASAAGADEAYGYSESVAYAAVRTPVAAAALARVFRSIVDAHPRAQPCSMVDFGAGHLPSYYAAKHVFGEGSISKRVLAIEPSRAMRQDAKFMLGVRPGNPKQNSPAHRDGIFGERGVRFRENDDMDKDDGSNDHDRGYDTRSVRARLNDEFDQFEYPTGVSFIPTLPPPSRMRRTTAPFELAVASYSLGELEDDYERDRVVRQLAGMLCPERGGYLVVVEPGTPRGSAVVRRARRVALDHISSLTTKLESLDDGSGELVAIRAEQLGLGKKSTSNLIAKANEPVHELSPEASHALRSAFTELAEHARATPPEMKRGAGAEGGGFPNYPRTAPIGATVIAPCFHAGACPYGDAIDESTDEASRRKTGWCHFAQRVRRPQLLRELKSHVPRTASFKLRTRDLQLREARGHGSAAGFGSGPFGGAPRDLVDFRGEKRLARDYQDEKFSYIVIYRKPVAGVTASMGVTVANEELLKVAHLDAAKAAGHFDAHLQREHLLGEGEGEAESVANTVVTEQQPETTAMASQTDPDVVVAAYKSIKYDYEESRAKDTPIFEEETTQDMLDRTLTEMGFGQRTLFDAHAAVLDSVQNADRKGSREWGRLVRPPLKRKRHVIVDVCRPGEATDADFLTQQVWLAARKKRDDIESQAARYVPPGIIERTIISRGKQGPLVYKWSRKLKWGDAFPTGVFKFAQGIQDDLLKSL